MAVDMTLPVGVVTAASSFAGLWAARLWWRASRLPLPNWVPPWAPGRSTGDPHVEMLGETAATVEALRALSDAMRAGAQLNARAAFWTGVSVIGLLAASVLTWAAASPAAG